MREKKNKKRKSDGSRIFRLPVKKIYVFLGSVMFLLCLAFPMPAFAERISQEETILEEKISSSEEAPSVEKTSLAEKTQPEKETSPAEEILLTEGTVFTGEAASGSEKTEEKETLTYESPIFTDGGEAFILKETRIEGEKEYRLVSKRIRNAKKAGEMTYAQVTIPYDLEGDDTVPETADVPLIDEESGTEFERELSLVNVEETSRSWSDTFSFSVTASGYGADSFYLGDMEIPGDADLADYGEKLLELAGLSREYYRVDRVEWDGEPYMDGEVTCRDATAEGSKLIRSVKAKYGGQIRTPDLEGKQYIGIYEEVLPETESGTEEEQETEILSQSEEEPDRSDILKTSLAERIIEWLESHVTTITVSIGILFLLAAGIWLFVKTGKKPGRQSP